MSEKGRCPAAFFFCSQRICTSTFLPIGSRLADMAIELPDARERVRMQCPFRAKARLDWRLRQCAVSVALKSKAPPEGSRRGSITWQSSRGDVLLPSQTPNWKFG